MKTEYFVSGTYTGKGDRPIRIITEMETDPMSLENFIYAADIETADRYYFNEKFLIKKRKE